MKDSIIADLKESYGITCIDITPVTGGWLNQKWKVSTDKGELLVKRYSNERFSSRQLEKIEAALQRHMILEKNNVPCPFIWQYGGHAIRLLNHDTAYMVMGFHSGKTENADTITLMQMNSLGSACGLMHKAFAQLPVLSVNCLPVYGGYTMDLLWENFNSCMMKYSPDDHVEYQKALLALEPILKQLRTGYFDKFPKGFTHEDFHPGNILFDEKSVSAVIDFDRNCYSYIWHDIGRAILSFALEGNKLNIHKVSAFVEGYSQHSALTLSNIADALRLSWCIETPWWIQPEFFGECNELPKRFKDEMLWLTEHWFEIDSILCSSR
jgi:homoserine kinase type II